MSTTTSTTGTSTTPTTLPAQPSADAELKAKHRTMWALGDYPTVVTDVISELGPHDDLVAAGGSYAALWESWHGKG